jgi:hypothetical protein
VIMSLQRLVCFTGACHSPRGFGEGSISFGVNAYPTDVARAAGAG